MKFLFVELELTVEGQSIRRTFAADSLEISGDVVELSHDSLDGVVSTHRFPTESLKSVKLLVSE